jgi:glycosyltransferase involved in cell wall biosynthesis
MRVSRALLDFIARDPAAEVLVVTNMWPNEERPVYGIFVKRQVDSLRAAGVPCDVLYLRGYRSALAYPRAAVRFAVASLAWRGRYRLVHVHAGETALAARFFVGPPMVVSYCGDDVLGDPQGDGSIPRRSRFRAALIRAHARLFKATITKSEEMHARLPQAVRRRNAVIPNGVDTELFRPLNRLEARRRLGWSEEERVVLFAATKIDIPRKRRPLAEAACKEVESRLGPVRLHVSGLTPPDEMPLLMSAADCLLHTASLEGSPNVVKEALACNLPVVATPAGDVRDLLDGVEPSFVCEPDPFALADALEAVLRDPRRSDGREKIEATLSATAVAGRVLELYERLVRGRDGVGRELSWTSR